MKKVVKDSERYQEMMNEVEAIVAGLNEGEVDIDDVVVRVEKGYKLIEKMRKRLDETKMKVETLLENSDSKKEDNQSELSRNSEIDVF